jgi:hypothetical protein
MDFHKSRVKALGARQRRQHRPGHDHFTSTVIVPLDVPSREWDAWLRAQPCACGVVGCPERRIGLLLPTKGQTLEEWEARYRHEARRAPVSFPEAELTVILNASPEPR